MKNIVLILSSLLVSQAVWADVLMLQPGPSSIENVNIAKAATATVEGRKTDLVSVGAGLRKEVVALIAWKV